MIILGFDWGEKNIGVSIGNNITKTARRLAIINNKNCWDKIKKLINIWDPKLFIVGCIFNFNKYFKKITIKIINFSKELSLKFKIKTKLIHEGYSSILNYDLINEINKKNKFKKFKKFKKLKKLNDDESARIILLRYFDDF